MLITKEQQESWVDTYVKEKHNSDECIGFIDGINKTLEIVNENLSKPDTIRSQSLHEFIDDVEYMQKLYAAQRYTLAEEWRDKLAHKLDDIMRAGSK